MWSLCFSRSPVRGPRLPFVAQGLLNVVGRRRSHLILDGDQTPLFLEQDRDVDVVPFSPDGDIRHLKADCGKAVRIRHREPFIDLVHKPFQEPCADTVGVAGPEQPRQHVAVADFVVRVLENVERVELPWFQELPMVCPEPGIVDQSTDVAFQASILL